MKVMMNLLTVQQSTVTLKILTTQTFTDEGNS